MSPVIINTRTAPAAAGAIVDDGTAFVASRVGGDQAKPVLVRSIADFEAAYSTRTGNAVACWDWLDAAFREGLSQAYVGSYTTAGDWVTGLGLFDSKYGPGQVAVVGETPNEQMHADLAAHGQMYGRFALGDVPQGATLSAMETLGDSAPTDATAEYIALFGPWLNYPPPMGIVGGSDRQIPASALMAGIIARVAAAGNPNRAAGGADFPSQYADSVVLDTTQNDRDALLTHKINAIALVNGTIQNTAFQTPVQQDPSTPFWQANCSRTRNWMKAKAAVIGGNYYMKNIDAEGHIAGALKNDLNTMMLQLYGVDALFGATPADAFDINVGSQVNNIETAAQAKLVAVTQAKLSYYAKTVEIDLVSVPITGQVVSS